jgi:hypothetical protein
MHYTTGVGLSGIITSGSLWSTHASALNDSQEITHFLDSRLIEIVREEARSVLAELIKDAAISANVDADGGFDAVSEKQTKVLSDLLRESMLKFHSPHIFSLSAITSDRARENGLLSQWRGYGTDGGYAIVFDSAGFEQLLIEEANDYFYQHMQWGDVYYYGLQDANQNPSEEIIEAENILRKGIRELHRSPNPRSMEESYDAMITLSCLYKHWGFFEEQEVRVIAIPPNDEVLEIAKAAKPNIMPRRTSYFSRSGMIIPYFDIFGSRTPPANKLPIKRVIVGPHVMSETRAKTVEMLLKSHGYTSEVIVSKIPYLGR